MHRPLALAAAITLAVAASASARQQTPFLASRHHISTVASTVPANGDVNPYGLAVVPASSGALHAGDYLVSNFNARSNDQGTGTTIVQIAPNGRASLFATLRAGALPGPCPGGVGLTTALGVLPGGYVVVGSLPTSNGKSATARAGCLIVLDSRGHAVETIAGADVDGPWDMATVTRGATTTLFVSNVLVGGAAAGVHTVDDSTIVRIRLHAAGGVPTVIGEQIVASKIPWRDDAAALVIGPTGLALAASGTLYVADTLESRIIAIPDAMTRSTALPDRGITLSAGGDLEQPLGLALAPNGDILTTNAGNGDVVETTTAGRQVAQAAADAKGGAGALFGLAVAPGGRGLLYVDDALNTLRLLH